MLITQKITYTVLAHVKLVNQQFYLTNTYFQPYCYSVQFRADNGYIVIGYLATWLLGYMATWLLS